MADAPVSPSLTAQMAPPSNGAVRAAALLLALGNDAAAVVLRAMSDDKMKEVARAARGLKAADKTIVDDAVARFVDVMESFDNDPQTRTRAFENILVSALGPHAAARALIDGPRVRGDELGTQSIVDADDADVAMLLERESPHVIALVLSVVQPEKAAAILKKLPAATQAPVVKALASLDSVQPDYVKDVVAGLAQQIRDLLNGPRRRMVGGERSAVDMLRKLLPDDRKGLLDDLTRAAPELAANLKGKLFAFDDMQRLGRRDIQALLQTCDLRTLALALKGAVPAVADVIYANMSQRAAAALREEIDMMGKVRLAQVEGAQAEIVKSIMTLAEEGKININLDEPMV